MASAEVTVDSLCATTSVVRSLQTESSACWMFLSVCVSRAEVASSRRTIRGDFSRVLPQTKGHHHKFLSYLLLLLPVFSPGNGHSLLLPSGQLESSLPDLGVVALREP